MFPEIGSAAGFGEFLNTRGKFRGSGPESAILARAFHGVILRGDYSLDRRWTSQSHVWDLLWLTHIEEWSRGETQQGGLFGDEILKNFHSVEDSSNLWVEMGVFCFQLGLFYLVTDLSFGWYIFDVYPKVPTETVVREIDYVRYRLQ